MNTAVPLEQSFEIFARHAVRSSMTLGATTTWERYKNIQGGYNDRSAQSKTDPDPSSNTEKDPDDWVTGDEPMTGVQKSYLKTLKEQVHAPEAFSENLSKAQASRRIDELKHGNNFRAQAR